MDEFCRNILVASGEAQDSLDPAAVAALGRCLEDYLRDIAAAAGPEVLTPDGVVLTLRARGEEAAAIRCQEVMSHPLF